MSDSTDQCDLIGFETLPRTPPISETTPGEFASDVVGVDRETSRETFDNDHQGLTMRLTGSQEAQHCF